MNTAAKSISIPHDFPDWLSPMVVKEVRQGLRGWLFVSLFLVLHLCLLSWGCLSIASNGASGSDGFFWFMLIVGMMVIVSRGIFSVRSERSDNTLELLQISRLNAFRVVAGKWVALMMQVGLFVISLLPYGLLRYYFEVFNADIDAKLFLFSSILAAVFAALAVYLSCLKKWIAWPGLVVAGGLAVSIVRAGLSFGNLPWSFILGLVALALLYIPFFILMGASSFSTDSENLATPKRVLGLLSLLPGTLYFVLMGTKGDVFAVLLALGAPLLFLAMSDALIAASAVTPFAVRNFRRFGWLGKLSASVFAPNRAAGFFYTVCIGLLVGVAGCLVCYSEIKQLDSLISALKGFLSFLFAAGAIIYLAASFSRLLMRRRPEATAYCYWLCIGVQIAVGIILVSMGTELADPQDQALWREVSLLSPIGCYAALSEIYGRASSVKNGLTDLAVIALTLQWILVIGLLALPVFKEAKNLRRLLRNERTDNRS